MPPRAPTTTELDRQFATTVDGLAAARKALAEARIILDSLRWSIAFGAKRTIGAA